MNDSDRKRIEEARIAAAETTYMSETEKAAHYRKFHKRTRPHGFIDSPKDNKET